jgi:hypothetical protein
VDARTLYADIRRDLSKAEAAETAELHAPFGGIHDRSFDVTHGGLSDDYLMIDSPCAGEKTTAINLPVDRIGCERGAEPAIIWCGGGNPAVLAA